MYSGRKPAARSPINSPTGSYRDPAESRSNGGGYQQRSSIAEDDENEYEPATYSVDDSQGETEPVVPKRDVDPYIAALQHRFPGRPPGDISYSRPSGLGIPPAPPLPSSTRRPANGPATPRRESNDSVGRTTNGRANNGTLALPRLRPVKPSDQNTYAARLRGEATSTSSTQTTRPAASGPGFRTNDSYNSPPRRSPITTPTSRVVRPSDQRNIEEEDDIRRDRPPSVLERERNRAGFPNRTTSRNRSPIASAYDYDQDPYSGGTHRTIHSSSRPYLTEYNRPVTPMLLLDDIRHINVALSKSGISLFPYERFQPPAYPAPMPLFSSSPFDPYYPVPSSGRRIIGEVVSACRLVEEEQPTWAHHGGGSQAVQNVWRAIRDHQPFSHTDPARPSVAFRDPYDV